MDEELEVLLIVYVEKTRIVVNPVIDHFVQWHLEQFLTILSTHLDVLCKAANMKICTSL
jgi:hypothetical protein